MSRIAPLSVVVLLSTGAAGHAETIIKEEFGCRHLETLERFDQILNTGRAALDFMKDQIRSGECFGAGTLKIGTSVRVEKRVKGEVCVLPVGSSEPCLCQWVSSEVIK